jgi:four helix bundle protein
MNAEELQQRTKHFALRVIHLCESLPNSRTANIIANQLIRSATSVGANYRAACRARSKADFISKIGITLEETDESVYWLEMIRDIPLNSSEELTALLAEGKALTAIFIASSNTARGKTSR